MKLTEEIKNHEKEIDVLQKERLQEYKYELKQISYSCVNIYEQILAKHIEVFKKELQKRNVKNIPTDEEIEIECGLRLSTWFTNAYLSAIANAEAEFLNKRLNDDFAQHDCWDGSYDDILEDIERTNYTGNLLDYQFQVNLYGWGDK